MVLDIRDNINQMEGDFKRYGGQRRQKNRNMKFLMKNEKKERSCYI